MKTIVSEQHFHEGEIKPSRPHARFHETLGKEFEDLLARETSQTACVCPGCNSPSANVAFVKSGLTYLECTECATVYASPRPTREALQSFYSTSEALQYWRDVVLPESRDARIAKVIAPRARWIIRALDRYLSGNLRVLDVGYNSETLINHLSDEHLSCEFIQAGEYSDAPALLRPQPNAPFAPADAIIAFDALDRAHDGDELFAACSSTLRPGGLMLVGTTLISGFDLQTLWDQSENINPPERLNLFSADGIMALATRHHFEIIEFSTPGVLDVEIVQRAVREKPDAPWPRFLRQIATRWDQATCDGFQDFLQKHRLSSFARLILRKR